MALSRALKLIVERLEARESGGPLAPSTLAAALRGPIDIDDVAPFIHFGAENYVRNLVAKSDQWELRLLCWRPGQMTSLHGHGASACAFRIVRGTAVETVLGERDRTWTPGAVIEELPRGTIPLVHQVGNAAGDALLSLHAYSPALPVDGPSPRSGYHVVIAGGGFAGTALAYHLLKRAPSDLRITLVERGPWLGRGVAYGVDGATFRLNVPASRMSMDPDVPDDFVTWSHAADRPHAFMERASYGAYVVARLAEALRTSKGRLRVLRGEASALEDGGVTLSDGRHVDANVFVLATGLVPRITASGLPNDPRVVDAWDECGLATLPEDGRILVLGAGLSALDIVALLDRKAFRGRIDILSRNGLLPRPHLEPWTPAPAIPADVVQRAPSELRALIRWVRDLARQAELDGRPWQSAIDGLRAHLPGLWASLSPEDRARFVRSIRPFWDVVRHRAPRESLARIELLRNQDRLSVLAGRIAQCSADAGGLDVDIQARGRSEWRRERYDAIVRCIGPALQHVESETPLVRSLLQARLAMRDPAGLGLVTDATGALVTPDGTPQTKCFALGAHRRASVWECTSVPDISVHARDLARHILERRG